MRGHVGGEEEKREGGQADQERSQGTRAEAKERQAKVAEFCGKEKPGRREAKVWKGLGREQG